VTRSRCDEFTVRASRCIERKIVKEKYTLKSMYFGAFNMTLLKLPFQFQSPADGNAFTGESMVAIVLLIGNRAAISLSIDQ